MTYLRSIQRTRNDMDSGYPFHMKAINHLESLSLDQPVTFFIGENGSGKTTLLEAIMILTRTVDLIPESHQRLEGARRLSKSFQTIWNRKTDRGFYLKSQSFITFVENIERMKSETQNELNILKEAFEDRSDYAFELASGPYNKTLAALTGRYGKGLHQMSHGEGYLELFKSRLVPGGLYILDEPELSLSPTRQLALISLMKEMVHSSCQFIIITHSPILMAFENAVIYEFDDRIKRVSYDDIEHVKITRDFLRNPNGYLKHL